jgi:hypothetical protein
MDRQLSNASFLGITADRDFPPGTGHAEVSPRFAVDWCLAVDRGQRSTP